VGAIALLVLAGCTTSGESAAVRGDDGTSASPSAEPSASGSTTQLGSGIVPATTATPPTASSTMTRAGGPPGVPANGGTATGLPTHQSAPSNASAADGNAAAAPESAARRSFPSVGLPGVNDPSCRSNARPVVLLHGTFSTVAANFAALVPALRASGRCVYGIDYGLGGTRSVTDSARSVATFIDAVLATAGFDQVDVVGFSQGGLVLRTALRQDDAADRVGVAVLIAPSFHGTTSSLLDALPVGACPACGDQIVGSPLLTELNAGGDLDGAVRYAVVSSRDDTIVTPMSSQVPVGPPDRVRSLVVQDQCPGERVEHVSLPADHGVVAWSVDALETDDAPDPAALTCG
jgi:triacylglycerol lipase